MNTTVIDTMGVKGTVHFETTLKLADLNWEPKEDKVGGMDTGIEMPRKKLLYRSDNKAPLGIVGADYSPSSPSEFLKAQFEFAEFIKGKVARAGFLAERSRAFTFVQWGNELVIPKGLRKVGDTLRAYIYSTDGWDGGTPRTSRLYIERLACSNGMTSREIKANLWVSHTSGMDERYNVRWKAFLAEIRTTMDQVVAQFTRLAKERMNEEQMKEFLVKLMPGEGKRVEDRRGEVLKLFTAGEGNQGITRWDAYNAVTEYVTHHRTYRKTESTSAETNRFLGVLETDTLNQKALSLLAAN